MEKTPREKRKKCEEDDKSDELFNYIGENSRSAKERGVEYFKDLEYCRTQSHVMRHPEVEPSEIDFRMEVISSHRSAFERQVKEAVMIERQNEEFSMNSKLEYSRTVLPKIKMKFGNKSEKEDPLITRENKSKDKISEMRSMKLKRNREKTRKENGETEENALP